MLAPIDEEDVLAFQDIERFGRVAMHVKWRAEAGWLRRLEQREGATGVLGGGLHGHAKAAQVDQAPVARSQYESAHGVEG